MLAELTRQNGNLMTVNPLALAEVNVGVYNYDIPATWLCFMGSPHSNTPPKVVPVKEEFNKVMSRLGGGVLMVFRKAGKGEPVAVNPAAIASADEGKFADLPCTWVTFHPVHNRRALAIDASYAEVREVLVPSKQTTEYQKPRLVGKLVDLDDDIPF